MGQRSEEEIRGLTAAVDELPEVRLAWLFGSRGRGTSRPDSDYDLAVMVEEACAADPSTRGQLIRRLAARCGREVPSRLIHVVLLNDAPVLLRHRVLRDGVLLLARSEEERSRFVRRTIREYQDTRLRRETARRVRTTSMREGRGDGRRRDLLAQARRAARLLAGSDGLP